MSNHICHIINNLSAGGAEQYVVSLSNYLNSNGVRVTIIAGEPHTLSDRLESGIHMETLEIHPGVTRSPVLYVHTVFHAIKRLINYLRREKVTVVHTHLAASALPAWIAAWICGVPVIHSTMHAVNVGSSYEKLLFASRLPLLMVDRFLAFTRYSENQVNEHWHVPKNRILSSSIGVDTELFIQNDTARAQSRDHFGIHEAEKVMLVVARLHPIKDVALAIKAAKFLDDPDAILLIAGEGSERSYLEGLAQELQGRTRVRFLGLLKDTRPAYAAADLLLQTSYSPNLGTVVLEAMASGVPVVIAYRDEEERKMAIDTFDGLHLGAIAKASPKAVAGAIYILLADIKRMRTLRGEVRDFVQTRHERQHVYSAMIGNYQSFDQHKFN
jgi:glycosyltransferase involved in cell wall biosynthesis